MDQWLCWNDLPLDSFLTQNGGNNASLIAHRGATPLAITADLSTHLLEVCSSALKKISLRIDDSLSPTSAHPFSNLPRRRDRSLSVVLQPQTRIENT